MSRLLLTTLALWVLILSPGLCIAGSLEHACTDYSEESSCAHGDDCASDPCNELVVSPGSSSGGCLSAPADFVVPAWLTPEPAEPASASLAQSTLPPNCANLPRPISDLPLIA